MHIRTDITHANIKSLFYFVIFLQQNMCTRQAIPAGSNISDAFAPFLSTLYLLFITATVPCVVFYTYTHKMSN
jgi:hypothetical protein